MKRMLSIYMGDKSEEGRFLRCLNWFGVELTSSENDIERLFCGDIKPFFTLGAI
jgi:hypothetical protein